MFLCGFGSRIRSGWFRWNDFLFGVAFSSSERQPITVALNNIVNTSTGMKEYNVDMAAALIAGITTLAV